MGCSSPQNATIPNIPHAHLNRVYPPHQAPSSQRYQPPAQRQQKVWAPLQDQTGYDCGGRIQKSTQSSTQTYGYECVTTIEELKKKRKEFWGNASVIKKPESTDLLNAGTL